MKLIILPNKERLDDVEDLASNNSGRLDDVELDITRIDIKDTQQDDKINEAEQIIKVKYKISLTRYHLIMFHS